MKILVISFASLMIFFNVFASGSEPRGSGSQEIAESSFSMPDEDIPPTTSLVYPGPDGKLVYVPDSLGNRIPDFSNAGYKGGG
ncbi:MAG: hypothetical protein GX999_03925, partial [Bacteroidales bacterium]|nr:hypothetical protein [Bacteroidales bacterium]